MKKLKNNTVFCFVASILVLFFIKISFTLAASKLESVYPQIPGLISPSETCTVECMSQYVGYFFGLGIYLAGALAVISLVFSGIQLMIGTINPESATNAKDRIKGSTLGLVLLMVSFLILNTINTTLVAPTLTALPGVAGVFYTNGPENKPSPQSEGDTSNIITGFENLKYICNDAKTAPKLLVWLYPEKNFSGYDGATTQEVECNKTLSLSSSKSFQTSFKTPGVYFYSGSDCSGFSSPVVLTSGKINYDSSKYALSSIKVVNDPNNTYYGVIVHETIDPTDIGKCQEPILVDTDEECIDLTVKVGSADIFIYNKQSVSDVSSGDGVIFYDNPFGWNAGARAGESVVDGKDIDPEKIIDVGDLVFDYTYTYVSPEEQALCADPTTGIPTFNSCQGSIEIKGNYLVASYSNSSFCQVFSQDVENLNSEKSIKNITGEKIKTIDIIATK